MKSKRIPALVAASAVLCSGITSLPNAQAATTSAIDCSTASNPTDFTVQPGESLTLTLTNCYGIEGYGGVSTVTAASISYVTTTTIALCVNPIVAPCTNQETRASLVNSVTLVAPSTAQALAEQFRLATPGAATYDFSVRVRVASPSPADGSSGSSSAHPAPITQQFGLPFSGACNDSQPQGLNWAGVPDGGWSDSYAMWMNGGAGGFVCTRELIYSPSVGGWIVN